ncbi:MAG: hypothetical protein HOP30_20770 [Cyclobacteriaceae bacterium]|nr:hypothetical protein [Cyclobacteriaceae bacterium]
MSAILLNILFGCQPEDISQGNGLTDTSLNAAFTIVADGTSPNKFTLKATNKNYIMSKWDIGDGAGAFIGGMEQSIFLPDAGTYNITHTAVGKGASTASATSPITVLTSDPNSGNIVQGGSFETSSDIAKWTILRISSSGTSWVFGGGKATVTGGGWNQQGFYQAITVIKDKTYKIDLVASSTTGVSNTWFEVYCSTTAPTQDSDYSADGIKRNINTWDGCGGAAFSGKTSNVGCNSSKNVGTFKAPISGTMYLVIKCGGEDLKGGISVDNIEVRGQ